MPKSPAWKLGAAALAAAAALAGAEALLRPASFRNPLVTPVVADHPRLPCSWVNPHYSGALAGAARWRSSGRRRIFFFGDSVTARLTPPSSAPFIRSGTAFFNFGVIGYDLGQVADYMSVILSSERPEGIFIGICLNDIVSTRAALLDQMAVLRRLRFVLGPLAGLEISGLAARAAAEMVFKPSLAAPECQLKAEAAEASAGAGEKDPELLAAAARARENGERYSELLEAYADPGLFRARFSAPLARIAGLSKGVPVKVSVWRVDTGSGPDRLAPARRRIEREAARLGFEVLDLGGAFGSGCGGGCFAPDGLHFTLNGSRIMLKAVSSAFAGTGEKRPR